MRVEETIAAALSILENAVANCQELDMRTSEVIDAIKDLLRYADERWSLVQFWIALSESGSREGRRQKANAALNGIKIAVARETRATST